MEILAYIIGATFLVSLGSFVGVFALRIEKSERIKHFLMALSSGALLGAAFFHLLPEALEKMEMHIVSYVIVGTILAYLVIEKVLHWHHCHNGVDCPIHSFGYMNLIGDGVHNLIDGFIIASSFLVSPELGITSTIAIALHEIPQEFGDFGVLLHAGFSRGKALFFNFLSAITAIAGGVLGWVFFSHSEILVAWLMPIAVGGFIYIAMSDMFPELRKEKNMKNFFLSLIFFIFGACLFFLERGGHGH